MDNLLLSNLIPADILINLNEKEINWLIQIFEQFGGRYPSLKELWRLMDAAWKELDCDPYVFDERVEQFYNHPVWLLNSLFVETNCSDSHKSRKDFAKWIATLSPERIADYGGGFGTLSRMIGLLCPKATVEVIEPYPHVAAISLAEKISNVVYCKQLTGTYDVIVATDVFEHIPDPLEVVATSSSHLKIGGYYVMANCFQPVILCHLPQNYHWNLTWDFAMKELGLLPCCSISYGKAYRRELLIDLDAARKVERISQQLYKWIRFLPRKIGKPIAKAAIKLSQI